MPFKSEAQRKYLWANEPEIARDWTDTYGSKIQAAHGGLIGSVGGISRPKYQQGNMVGAEMGGEMEGAVMQSQEVIKELYDALIAEGLSPQEAMKKIKEIIASSQTEEPEAPMMAEEFPGQEFSQGPRTPAAFGGIMDTYTGRRKYGLGSFIKKAVRKIKKIAKSPIGKAALLYAGTAGLGALGAGAAGRAAVPGQSWMRFLKPGAIKSTLGATKGNLFGYNAAQQAARGLPQLAATKGKLGDWGLTQGYGKFMPTGKGWGAVGTAATLAPFAMQATGNWEQDQLPGPNIAGQEFDFDYGQMRKDIADAVAGGDYNEFTEVLGNYGLTEGANIPNWGSLAHGAEGGRVGMQSGGDTPEVLGPVTPGKGITDIDTGDFNLSDLGEYTQMYGPEGAGGMTLKEMVKFLMTKGFSLQAAIAKAAEAARGGMGGRDEVIEEQVTEGPMYSPERKFPKDFEWPKGPAIPLPRPIRPEHPDDRYYPKTPDEGMQPYGRTRAQEGGLMNLGGMEKDYRNDGGFVPLGGEEKADDVPARLSKNEFVFTADAVRNAGGGDIDRGAEVMENVMKNLEGGGKISEESQGQGAQEMFETSERLSEVV